MTSIPTFSAISKNEYFQLLLRRMHGEEPELTWLTQFRDILAQRLCPGQTLLDVGCATGYAARALAPLALDYLGVDAEPTYLEPARQWFSKCTGTAFAEHDIMTGPVVPARDAVICCAMLEHCAGLHPTLDNLARSCRSTLLLRTFMGHAEELVSIPSPNPAFADVYRKPVNQYAFSDIFNALDDHGFDSLILRDRYTDSMPRFVYGQVRTFHVLLATRRSQR